MREVTSLSKPAALSLLSFFRRNRQGATAVEFGLIAMPVLAMLGFIFEIAYANIQNELLSNAVTDAARAMMTGRTQANNVSTAKQFISTYLCQASGPRTLPTSFNCSNLIVDIRPASSFTAGDMANDFYKSATNEYCPGQAGAIMIMRVAYPLPAIFPINLFSRTAGTVSDVPNLAGNYHMLMGEELFQEELYSGSYTPPSGC